MTVFQALILSIVQGITEFLPISSSGHLILFPKLFSWPDQGLAFDAIVHLGTTAAILVYFRLHIKRLVQDFFSAGKRKLFWVFFISMLPAIVVGVMLEEYLSGAGRSIVVVSCSLIGWGIVLMIAEWYSQRQTEKRSLQQMRLLDGLLIGLAQSIALIPGTSRSGITISTGYFLNIEKKDAVTFSFLMAVPVILGAGLLKLFDLWSSPEIISWWPISAALLGSFLSGLVAIHVIRILVYKDGFYIFGVYRILLGLLLLAIFV